MGDFGSAVSSGLSGIGSGLSDALSGVGSALSSGGVGNAVSSMFGGGAAGGAAPAASTDPGGSFTQAVDPTGSIAAQEAINPPGSAPTAAQSQNQQGQQPAKPATPPPQEQQQTGLDQLRKLLQRARGVSPYQTGAGAGSGQQPAYSGYGPKSVPEGPIQDPLMPSPLGQAAAIDTSGVPPAGGPLGLRPGESGEGVGTAPEDQPLGPSARNPRAAATGQGAVGGATQPQGAPPAPEIGPGSAAASAGIPALAKGALGGIASVPFTATPAETGELPPTAANIPADQRNMPYPGQQYAPDPSIAAQPQITPPGTTQGGDPRAGQPGRGQPSSTPIGGGPGNVQESPTGRAGDPTSAPLSKKQYEDVLKGQGVSPSEAKKQADKSTPADRARAAGALPTHKPGYTPGSTRQGPTGISTITRDRAGMQGMPQMLGELAKLAVPLLSMAMSGGFGGGGRGHRGFPFGHGGHGRFGGEWRGGHPGGFGSGMWPYHHPGMGWSGFNHHPGGGWMPLHPKYMASMGGQVGGFDAGGGGQDQTQQLLAALGMGGGQQGQGGQQGGGFQQGGRWGGGQGGSSGGGGASGGYGGGGDTGPPVNGPWSSNPFLSTIVQAESGGREGPNVRGDGGQAKGFFQFHDGTWQRYARNVPGASQYASAEGAPPEMQQAVAMSAPISEWGGETRRKLHARFGNFDEHMTIGQLSQQFGGGTQTAGNTPPGTVGTGDPRAPNPDGNVVQRNFDNSPLTVAQQ
jgi:hypothetical protein